MGEGTLGIRATAASCVHSDGVPRVCDTSPGAPKSIAVSLFWGELGRMAYSPLIEMVKTGTNQET